MAADASRLSTIRTVGWILAIGIIAAAPATAIGQDALSEYELIMFNDPPLTSAEVIERHPPGLKQLWLRALDRPDAELQRLIIDSITMAHQRGIAGMEETVPRLLALLAKPNQPLDVSRAAINALIEMDVRDQAANIADIASRHGPSLAQIVEPSLAAWKSPVMKDAWLRRVNEATAGQSMMLLAIDGLAALQSSEAVDSLVSLMRSKGQQAPVRLAAARGLGLINSAETVDLATATLQDDSTSPQLATLLTIRLLSRRDDETTVQLLKKILQTDNAAVQSLALNRLFEIDPAIVDGLAREYLASTDVNVRRWCVRAILVERRKEQIEPLAKLLDDVNPTLRRLVASGLLDLAQRPQLHDEVTAQAMSVLNQSDWRGCEQAAVVVAKLDYKPSGARLVELLGHERGEVMVAAAWALKQLKIPELLPDMLEHAQSVYEGFKTGQLDDSRRGASLKMAHLFEAFGLQKYLQANGLMRQYLPKDFALGNYSRPAAAWGLGLIYEDEPQEDLVRILSERLRDATGAFPESKDMRIMCAVCLGRMRAESALSALRSHATGTDGVSQRCYWAIERITGEPPPEFQPISVEIDDWLLSPLPPARAAR